MKFLRICFIFIVLSAPFATATRALGECDPAKAPGTDVEKSFAENIKIFFPKKTCFEILVNKEALKGFRYIAMRTRTADGEKEKISTVAEITDGEIIITGAVTLRDRSNIVEALKNKYALPVEVSVNDDEHVAGDKKAKTRVIIFCDFDVIHGKEALNFLFHFAGRDAALYHKPLSIFSNSAMQAKMAIAAKRLKVKKLMEKYNGLYAMNLGKLPPEEAEMKALGLFEKSDQKKIKDYISKHDRELSDYIQQNTELVRSNAWRALPAIVVNDRVVPGGFNKTAFERMLVEALKKDAAGN